MRPPPHVAEPARAQPQLENVLAKQLKPGGFSYARKLSPPRAQRKLANVCSTPLKPGGFSYYSHTLRFCRNTHFFSFSRASSGSRGNLIASEQR